jgi:chaperonin GroES
MEYLLSTNICQRPIAESNVDSHFWFIGAQVWRVPMSFYACHPYPEISRRSISMKFSPLHDRVLVRRIVGDEKTTGGLIIPETAKEKPQEGEVISVGTGARDDAGARIEMDVKAGDRVLFGKWSGTEVKIDGEAMMIMKESDILGIMA